jgi:hypothetical protein
MQAIYVFFLFFALAGEEEKERRMWLSHSPETKVSGNGRMPSGLKINRIF